MSLGLTILALECEPQEYDTGDCCIKSKNNNDDDNNSKDRPWVYPMPGRFQGFYMYQLI